MGSSRSRALGVNCPQKVEPRFGGSFGVDGAMRMAVKV
jgi:hypothetical protein